MWPLITSADVKQISKGAQTSDFDALFDAVIIPAVTLLIAQYLGRPDFDKAQRTEIFNVRHHQEIIRLSSPPIASTPAIQLWEDSAIPRAYGAASLLVNGTDYFTYSEEGYVAKLGWFMEGWRTVKVTYTGGYMTSPGDTSVPADIRLAAMLQTKAIFDRREEIGLTGRSLEGGSIQLLNVLTLPMQVTKFLDPYRIIRV